MSKGKVDEIVSPFEIRELRTPDYEIEIVGKLISKKNRYGVSKGRIYKTSKIKTAEQVVYLQIENEHKRLKLRNPSIMVERYAPKASWRSDSDGGWTFLLDCLVNAGVLHDDSMNHFNGVIVHMPVKVGDRHRCVLKIWENKNGE